MIFRRMTDMHLLWVSGADIEVWKDSRSRVLQKLSTFSWSTSHDVKALSHLAETSTVGTASFANASMDRLYCKHDLSESGVESDPLKNMYGAFCTKPFLLYNKDIRI